MLGLRIRLRNLFQHSEYLDIFWVLLLCTECNQPAPLLRYIICHADKIDLEVEVKKLFQEMCQIRQLEISRLDGNCVHQSPLGGDALPANGTPSESAFFFARSGLSHFYLQTYWYYFLSYPQEWREPLRVYKWSQKTPYVKWGKILWFSEWPSQQGFPAGIMTVALHWVWDCECWYYRVCDHDMNMIMDMQRKKWMNENNN